MRAWLSVLLTLGVALWSKASFADAVDRASTQLKGGDDFRVRTQAALALGSSKSKRAVTPLCNGLDDDSTTVRAASAAALGKLKKGGEGCLKARLKKEGNSTVKSSIKKALANLKAGGEPTITESSKFYIAIAKTTDKTGRSGDEVDSLVRKAMSKAADNIDGYVIAPASETATEAKQRLGKWKQLKGFYLSPKILAPKYAGDSLTIKVEIAIFTYPGKALKGSIPVNLTMEGVSDEDKSSEDELIERAVARALEKFSQNVERIQ
jgi:hypothetical protein